MTSKKDIGSIVQYSGGVHIAGKAHVIDRNHEFAIFNLMKNVMTCCFLPFL